MATVPALTDRTDAEEVGIPPSVPARSCRQVRRMRAVMHWRINRQTSTFSQPSFVPRSAGRHARLTRH